jgi:CP family cyanate transporter-like MFS transporter
MVSTIVQTGIVADDTYVARHPWAASPAIRLVGILAIALLLRPSVAGVGPIIDDIQDGLGLPGAAISLLTAVPVLCFGFGSVLGPAFARWFGVDVSLTVALGLLAVALLVRVSGWPGGPGLLFAGTTLSGLSIAVMNVLLPRLVKQDFPSRAGLVTGLYTSMLGLAAAVSALVAVPLKSWTGQGWRGSLFVWGLVGVVAFVIWSPQLLNAHREAAPVDSPDQPRISLLRNKVAIALTGFMGLQSLGFYVCLAWLPSLLRDSGYSETAAGAYLSILTGLGVPLSIIVPLLAVRAPDQRFYAVGTTALVFAGFLGLLLAPNTGTLIWVILLGIGTASTFPLTLLMIVLRASTPQIAGQLSAMAQGFGYLICAIGPFTVGVLHDAFDSWRPALVLLLVLVGLQAAVGWVAGRAEIAA